MAAEELAKVLGRPGRFQVVLFIVLSINTVFLAWNHVAMAFFGAKTKHHCRVENETAISTLVPLVDEHGKNEWDGCHVYARFNTTEKIPCPDGWTYYLSDREWTVLAEWDLVCDNTYKVGLATTLYFCGVMLGGLLFGPLADKFGRRPVLLLTMYTPAVIGVLMFLFRKYFIFVTLRFILGFLVEGFHLTSFTSSIELLAIQYRTRAGVLGGGVCFSFGVMSLALVSYLVQDWRYIQLCLTLVVLLQLGLICFLPESIRWLLIKKRVDEAERVVEKIATFNNLPFPREVFDKAVESSVKTAQVKAAESRKNYTIVDIFRSSTLRKRSIILALVWFSMFLGYFALSFNVSSFAGNKHLNLFIGGTLELAITIVTLFALERFGRRKPWCLYFVVGGITCLSAGVLSTKESLQTVTTVLALSGRTCLAGCVVIGYVYTSELYPTVIRNVGVGAAVFWGTIGSIASPQVLLLGKYTADSIPFIIMGACVLVAGGLALLLPETLNVKLPETVEDAGKLKRSSREVVGRDYDMKPVIKESQVIGNPQTTENIKNPDIITADEDEVGTNTNLQRTEGVDSGATPNENDLVLVNILATQPGDRA